MIKKYKDKIKQYDLEGNLIKIFDKPKDALDICNYDSIIRCCLGKYKTAGGYIWRFFNDDFNKDQIKKGNIKCKICGLFETERSMAMHLKWSHSMKTEDYIVQYEEFRKKKIEENLKKEKSNIKCKICNEKMNSNQHLMYHITKTHKEITQNEYIIKYMLDDKTPVCKCGCGQPVEILRNGKNCDLNKETYNRDYIKGHWDWEVFSNIGKQSNEEIELLEFVKTIYKGNIEPNKRGLIKNREIDIFIPDVNIGIEYNGLYWHSEKAGKDKNYHLNKMIECNKIGIRLIQIFSDEWINNKDIIKNKLKSILNSNNSNKIYARKCIVKEINPKIKNEFLNQNHIQGGDKSKIKLGLFHKDELVAVMTFSNPRMVLNGKKENDKFELSRYATSKNIIGGASKLLSFFIKKYKPKNIYSYSDNRWTDPNKNMYLSIGFKKINTSKPGYFYTKDFLKKQHRFYFSKQNLKKRGIDIKNKTEKNIMESLGYTRIWDCGTTKYSLDLIQFKKQ